MPEDRGIHARIVLKVPAIIAVKARLWMSRAGARNVLSKVNKSFGSGTATGSGENSVIATAAPKSTTRDARASAGRRGAAAPIRQARPSP